MPNKEKLKLKSEIFFSQYKLLAEQGEGSFGKVYSGYNINTNEKVALKIEKLSKEQNFLELEAVILYYLKGGEGIPAIISYGYSDDLNILIMELLGKSLDKLHEENKSRFSLKTVCMIAHQMINRLEYIHNKNLIHRDIKPENFALGLEENRNIIYLFDFGLAKKYRNNKTGEHIKYVNNKRLTGTARYASANALSGFEQSRRDDLEGMCYVLIYFLKGVLPWQGLKFPRKEERYRKIYEIKKTISIDFLVDDSMPKEFRAFVKYCRGLRFDENPDYEYLRNIIKNIMNTYCLKFDYDYDWCFSYTKNKSPTSVQKQSKKIVVKTEESESNVKNASQEMVGANQTVQKDYKFITKIKQNSKKNVRLVKKEMNEILYNTVSPREKPNEVNGVNELRPKTQRMDSTQYNNFSKKTTGLKADEEKSPYIDENVEDFRCVIF